MNQVSGWGQMLVAYNKEKSGIDLSNAVFTQVLYKTNADFLSTLLLFHL